VAERPPVALDFLDRFGIHHVMAQTRPLLPNSRVPQHVDIDVAIDMVILADFGVNTLTTKGHVCQARIAVSAADRIFKLHKIEVFFLVIVLATGET
jgi:hypothetical protein